MKPRPIPPVLFLLCIMFLVGQLCLARIGLLSNTVQSSTATMSREEEIVRSAYAKMAYSTQIYSIKAAVEDSLRQPVDSVILGNRIADETVSFQLTKVQVGDFAQIAKTAYGDLVTKPNGEAILPVATGFWVYTTDAPKETKAATGFAAWTNGPVLTEDWTVPFASAIQKAHAARQEDMSPYKRYAAVSLTVKFQGQSRSYRSLFLFGTDPSGKERILPVDTVVGGPALTFFLNNSVFPAVLFEPDISKIPFVSQWLRSNAAPGVASGQVSCDLQTLKCSVPQADVARALGDATRLQYKRRATLVEVSFHPKPKGRFFFQTADCTSHNTTGSSLGATQVDSGDHLFGGHNMSYGIAKSCTYSNGTNTNNTCDTSCSDTITATPNESGQVISGCHVVQISQQVGGTSSATGAGANCNASVAVGARACFFCLCNITFSVTGSGATVTISSDGFYTAQQNDSNSCASQAQPTPTPSALPPPPPPDPTPTDCPPDNGDPQPICFSDCGACPSPIIIDLNGKGFFLTDAVHGVLFDIKGNGQPLQIAWIAQGADNAFLALPGPDGLVHTGKQLFGNFTPQPPSNHPNGFIALAVYDGADHGGNGDGIIDDKDLIFSSLRLWIDENHDGICQPGELHILSDLGVSSISLNYLLSHRVDDFGNVFRYRAKLNSGIPGESEVGRKAYDVFFTHM